MVHALDEAKNTRNAASDLVSVREEDPANITALFATEENGNDSATVFNEIHSGKRQPLNYECHIEICGISDESNYGGVPSSLMFLVALGLHSVFEGIAVGLQKSTDKILEYSVAILLHELVMALTFGLEVSKSPLKKGKKLIYVLIFTSSIPVGIAIGIGLQSAPTDNRELISAIIEAFATGIFIHVIFIEILANEFPHLMFDRHKCRLSTKPLRNQPSEHPTEICLILEKIFCICCGFLLLILMNVFLHGHSH